MAKLKRELSDKRISDILSFDVAPGAVAYKSITQQLRELILSKALLPGTRLPTLAELAGLWNTNYYTVQTALTPLVNEGLLVRRQRTGTFIAETTQQIKAVGIYFGASFLRLEHGAFYQTLYATLCDHFESKGITVHLFMDSRAVAQKGTPFKPLMNAIRSSEVGAVIGSMLTEEQVAWLDRLTIPVSLFTISAGVHPNVFIGMEAFLKGSLARLKARKCRSVALIGGTGLPGFNSFADLAKEFGMKSRPEWVFERHTFPEHFEEFGFESFIKIWSGQHKPDGLIIYPDNIAQGVIMAILQKGIRVPEELKLVIHCNEEIFFFCPLPADWQVVKITKLVEMFWKHLCAQASGKASAASPLNLSMQPASPDSLPVFRKWGTWQATK